ncbi:MAG: DegQ family serine endoprotease [Gammaproteobacteria bacterium]|nr:DegQ family serine endoprotease [Gammaproteobacteria bacterium]
MRYVTNGGYWVLLLVLGFGSAFPAFASLPDFTELAEASSPAVVNISTTQKKSSSAKKPFSHHFKIPDIPGGSELEELFRRFFDQQGGSGGHGHPFGEEGHSLGSGFIIDEDGHILTNHHVVEDADEVIVRLSDRRELQAEVLGVDKRSDLALLKVEAKDLPVVSIGKSSRLKVGEWVVAIGSPFGFDHSVSAGIVSALGRNLPSENYVPFIQTDVAINPGNSGGPLFNLKGEVIGINSQIYSRTGGFMGLSFAIPIDVAMNVVQQLKDNGYVTRGWLGVLIQDVTRELAESFAMEVPKGALVAQIFSDSPAAKAGIEVGDVITEYNGVEVINSSDLPPLVGRTPIGSKTPAKVIRDGKVLTLQIEIGELPEDEAVAGSGSGSGRSGKTSLLGMSVAAVDDAVREELDLEAGGVVVARVVEGAAARAGIEVGDVITRLNNHNITDPTQFMRLVEDLPRGRSVPVLVLRKEAPRFLALKVPEE